ncbi:MAG: helix-turn-helix transcriptional regulator [Candidatus Saccharimonadales bacterium]
MDSNRYKKIGGRIRDARIRVGLTQQQLAEAVGYKSSTAISLIESGERRVQINELEEIGRKLSVTIGYLLDGEVASEHKDVSIALRADEDLSEEDVKGVMNYIEWMKSQRKK